MTAAFPRYALCLVFIAALAAVVWKFAPLPLTSPSTSPAGGTASLGPQPPPGSVLVNVGMTGFDPASIEAKAGQPLDLAFFRPNAANCVRVVVFPDLGIRKQLPPGETVVVRVTPPKSGSLGFECDMSMLKGRLVVR
jgi:hypothetical protein